MDNQKSNDGGARDIGREGAGRGKDMNPDAGASRASVAELHQTIDAAAGGAQPAVDRLTSSAHAGVDKMSDALAGAARSTDEKTRQLADSARKFADTGRQYVRSSPVTSILVALGAGYILSRMMGRR